MLYYQKSAKQTLEDLKSSKRGLSTIDADTRLKIHGRNLVSVRGEPLWRKLAEPFANVFMLVLFIAAAISLFHGDILDASIIGVIMATSATIYYVQRFSTERILRALKKHDPQTVEVQRDNKSVRLDAELLVPGDIISLAEGERIPADCRILDADSLRVDESQLTGESEPISKQTDVLKGSKEVYERSNMLFQGSFLVSGTVLAVITSTGNQTEFGQLAALTQNATEPSPVQKKIDKLLSQIIAVVAAMAVGAFILSQLRGMELAESFRFIIALSVSAVPESLPVAISVVLVLGMRRMAAKKALVRTMRAIETIGTITTIATDKTGTLTKNKLTVLTAWTPASAPIPDIMAGTVNQRDGKLYDPLDGAFLTYAQEHGTEIPKYRPAEVFPFDQAMAMSGNLWHKGSDYTLTIKGAPEHILASSNLTESERETAGIELQKLTAKGYRVIAIAHLDTKKPLTSLNALKNTPKLEFDGFVAVADVLRPEAKKAIETAINAGVTVRMITGDHFETAFHIGKQLGMVSRRDQVFDSRRMHVMSDEELEKIIGEIRVFSRVIPEHKYRILSLLKKNNITAMTGDGVNDVPALTNAHVGVAMGSGAHIAKDAGDIILTDDNFKGIVDAMREGRTIFANIRRMLYYLLATNTGEVLTMIGALIIGLPVPLLPVQILWINLVTDTSMVIPLGLEPGEKTNMTTKPLPANAPILSKYLISRMVIIALAMAGLTISLYAAYSAQYGHEYGRTIAFSSLVVMQWASAFCARSEYQSLFKRLGVFNGKFYIGLAVGLILQTLVLFGPFGPLLHITPVAIGDLAITAAIAFAVPIILVEIHKWFGRRYVLQGN
jgi:Ca2+-transporting ATPase